MTPLAGISYLQIAIEVKDCLGDERPPRALRATAYAESNARQSLNRVSKPTLAVRLLW